MENVGREEEVHSEALVMTWVGGSECIELSVNVVVGWKTNKNNFR